MVLGPVLLLVASVLGLANAAYFTLVAYGVLQETQGLGKAVCDVTKAPCAAVVDTPYAKLFGGIPNSVLGVAWHAWGLSAGLLGVRSLAIPFVRESLV
ncbi:MAG: vitamin K epoxide reductase family protein, partial [Methanobacteriota archaeon]